MPSTEYSETITSLYLVRHGETEWNAQRRIQGATDIPLNAVGRGQAQTTGRLLARRQWDGIFASPLQRAQETAEIIARELGMPGPTTIDAIAERNYGEAEGLTWDEVERAFPNDSPVPGRESREDVADRALPALISLAARHPGESLIVVSHGGVIRAVLGAVDPGGTHGSITNGSIHSFEYLEGSLQLIEFDDAIDELSLESATVGLADQNAVERRDESRG